MHVIVGSSNPAIVDALSRMLHPHGHRVTACGSGLEVLGAVEVLAVDLLIVDLETPGLNGSLMISAIKELAPALPIVAVSTRAEAVDARALSRKGVMYATFSPRLDGGAPPVRGTLAEVKQGDLEGAEAPEALSEERICGILFSVLNTPGNFEKQIPNAPS